MEHSSRNSFLSVNLKKEFNYGDRIINKKYTIFYKIADQQHSKVYSLSTKKNNKQVIRAIKCEHESVEYPQISKQVAILKKVFARNQFQLGFPRLYEYGSTENMNYMITTILGPNIAQLHKLCNNRFSPLTCLLVGLQILDRIEKIHEIGFVYRDIKLQNFVIGLGNESSFIHMIDFGHCQRFRNRETGSHVPYKEGNFNIQDTNFVSINVHDNVHYTRRDDIQSLLYLIIYMYKARLPWRKVEAKTKKQKDQKIAEIKRVVSPSYLANNFGLQMADLFWYIRSVNFYQKPDYEFIRSKIYSMILAKSQNKERIDIKYDWNERQEMDYTIYNGEPKLFLNKNQSQSDQDEDNSVQMDEFVNQNAQGEQGSLL